MGAISTLTRHPLAVALGGTNRRPLRTTGEVRAAYLFAADTLGEGFEKDQVYAALVRAERRPKQ